jgi:Phycobilisome protein
MNAELKAIIEQAQDRYLKADDLLALESFISSLPERLSLYRTLRDREISILQLVANQLEAEIPNAEIKQLETAIKYLSLLHRYSAMAMLMQDRDLVDRRLLKWLGQVASLQETQSLDQTMFRLFNQVLNKELSHSQIELLNPFLTQAKTTFVA